MLCPLQPIMFHKRQNSNSRYFASEGKIDKTANCLAGHGQRWATATSSVASLPLPLFVKFNSGATAAVPE